MSQEVQQPPSSTSAPSAGSGLSLLLSPVRGRLVTAAGLSAVSAVMALVPLVAVARIGQILLTGGSAGEVWRWCAIGVAGGVLRVVLYSAAMGVSHYADAEFRVSVRRRIVDHLRGVNLGWFIINGSATIKKSVTDDVKRLHVLVAHVIPDLAAVLVAPILAIVYLLTADWLMAVLVVGYILLVSAVALPAALRSAQTYYDDYDAAVARTSRATVELVDGIEVVKTFGSRSGEFSRFESAVDEFIRVCVLWTRAGGRPMIFMSVLLSPATMTLWIVALGAVLISTGWLQPWELLPFLLVGVGLPVVFTQIHGLGDAIRQAHVAAGDVKRVGSTPTLSTPEQPATPANVSVKFESVSFSYGTDSGMALQNIDLTLHPGTITALVGRSGSGKTTVARLLVRFWDVTEGSVSVGGVDVRDMDPGDLLRRVSMVFQESVVVRDTVRDNIRLGRPTATDDEVTRACEVAQIDEVIRSLPNGYDTILGEEASLSGGELQRVTIARAILVDAPIVILDEATAHADPHNEAEIQRGLGALAADKTVLVIAHRLRTITHADQIVVLDEGRIVERGTHDELLALGDHYDRLWQAQTIPHTEMGTRP